MSTKTILTGIQPSGALHLGNYFGAAKKMVALQAAGDCYLFIANYHALTTVHEADVLRDWTFQLAVDYLALGIDPDRTVLYRQSDVPEVQELTWLLSNVINVGFLQTGTSYKDKVAKGIIPSVGLFNYPVLMASDILCYDSDLVPVGKDQAQHLEFTRRMARAFNHRYGEVLRVPEALIDDETALVPGTDGGKMSKSLGNTIPVFLKGKKLKKALGQIVTDSTPLEEPKDPDTCNVMALYKLFASDDEVSELAGRYRAGNFGYGHAKLALQEAMERELGEAWARRDALMAAPERVEAILQDGAERARVRARAVLDRALRACGIR